MGPRSLNKASHFKPEDVESVDQLRPLLSGALDLVDQVLQEDVEAGLDPAEALGEDFGNGVTVRGKLGQVHHEQGLQAPESKCRPSFLIAFFDI